jgi:hypothetical protein
LRRITDAGHVTHEEAVQKAEAEYDRYRKLATEELTPVEHAYLETLKDIQKRLETNGKNGFLHLL